jgi:hypothetical protein
LFPDDYVRQDRLSPDFYEESETDPGTEELPARIFVALFDYDPLTMSPNPDAAEEELPFKEGQIIKVSPAPGHISAGRGVRWGQMTALRGLPSSPHTTVAAAVGAIRGDGSAW